VYCSMLFFPLFLLLLFFSFFVNMKWHRSSVSWLTVMNNSVNTIEVVQFSDGLKWWLSLQQYNCANRGSACLG
jgi:hypothetical protein